MFPPKGNSGFDDTVKRRIFYTRISANSPRQFCIIYYSLPSLTSANYYEWKIFTNGRKN